MANFPTVIADYKGKLTVFQILPHRQSKLLPFKTFLNSNGLIKGASQLPGSILYIDEHICSSKAIFFCIFYSYTKETSAYQFH